MPMRQSPAIFLQHSISTAVICAVGRHASAGVTSQSATRLNANIVRQRAMTKCYISVVCKGKSLPQSQPALALVPSTPSLAMMGIKMRILGKIGPGFDAMPIGVPVDCDQVIGAKPRRPDAGSKEGLEVGRSRAKAGSAGLGGRGRGGIGAPLSPAALFREERFGRTKDGRFPVRCGKFLFCVARHLFLLCIGCTSAATLGLPRGGTQSLRLCLCKATLEVMEQ